jgi:acetylornithine deacetylase
MSGAISYPPPETLLGVQAEFQQCIDETIAADEWMREHPPTVEWISGTTATYVPPEHPLYTTVEQSVEKVTGVRVHSPRTRCVKP